MPKPKRKQTEADKLNMTPMIDVVFQLIVFFLVSMKFKTLDMKIEAFLPKDRGLAVTQDKPKDVPKLVAVLQRKKGEPTSRVKVANSLLGTISIKPEDQAASRIVLDKLTNMASEARKSATAMGADPNEVKGEVDAGALVPSGDVIMTVDAFIAGGLKDVTFVGTPPPDSTLFKLNEAIQK